MRNTKIPAGTQGSCSIRYALASLNKLSHLGVGLEALELLVRIDIRVFIVQADDQADVNIVGCHVVEE